MTTAQKMINAAKEQLDIATADWNSIVREREANIVAGLASKPIDWELVNKRNPDWDRARLWHIHCEAHYKRIKEEWEGDTITSIRQLMSETTDETALADLEERRMIVYKKNMFDYAKVMDQCNARREGIAWDEEKFIANYTED